MAKKRLQPGSKKGEAKPIKRKLDPKFSERLADTMKLRGFTLSDGKHDVSRLAKLAGCTRAVIHKYLKPGESKTIEPHLLFALADALDVSARWLLEAKGGMAQVRALDPEQDRALNLFGLLQPQQRDLWLAQGEEIRARQPQLIASKESPFQPAARQPAKAR